MGQKYQVYLVSDSTGETLDRIFLALKSQFSDFNYEKKEYVFVRTEQQINKIINECSNIENVIILYPNILREKKNQIKDILEKLIYFLCLHIKNQILAGSEVVQIFDSWAGLLPENKLNEFCYEPNLKIVNFCKKNKIPTICFPRGINKNYIDFINIVKPECVNIDYNIDPQWARENFNNICIQGGMDPKVLLSNDEKIYNEAEKYLKTFKNYPYIFNLGHGMLPETDPNNVEKLVRFVKEY